MFFYPVSFLSNVCPGDVKNSFEEKKLTFKKKSTNKRPNETPSRDPADEPRLKPWIDKGLVGFQPPKTPWRDFLKKIESSRVLFAPNGHDASPRVIAEALSLDVAVLVNANIDGGWKYGEHEEAGATFTSAADVLPSYDKILRNYANGKLAPRRWFKENSGIKNSAIRLEAFLELAVGEERLARAAEVGAKVTQ